MAANAIRQVGLPDRALLRVAVERFAPAATERTSSDEWITGFVAGGGSFAFVAVDADDDLIGWVWGWHHRRPVGPPIARLETLEVSPDSRRAGVGSMLFDAAFAHARRLECCELVIELPDPLDVGAKGFLDTLRPMISPTKRVHWSL